MDLDFMKKFSKVSKKKPQKKDSKKKLEAVSKNNKRKSITAEDIARQQKKQNMKESIKDILPSLQVMPTFKIPDDCLIPQDMDSVNFDLQVPQGYDVGQVTQFLLKSKKTIKFYWALLEQRNDDVVKLANVIYQLQGNLDDLMRENAVSDGINIMATEDDEELERALLEAKLKITRLEDEIKQLKKNQRSNSTSSVDSEEIKSLRNEILELRYELENKEEEIEVLKGEDNPLLDKTAILDPRLYDEKSDEEFSLENFEKDEESIEDKLDFEKEEEVTFELPEYNLPEELDDEDEPILAGALSLPSLGEKVETKYELTKEEIEELEKSENEVDDLDFLMKEDD